MSKNHLIQRQKFMQANIPVTLFSKKRQGALIRAGTFVRMDWVFL